MVRTRGFRLLVASVAGIVVACSSERTPPGGSGADAGDLAQDSGASPDANSFPDAEGWASLAAPTVRRDIHGVADPGTGLIAFFGGDDGPVVNQIPKPHFIGDTWVLDPTRGWSEVTTTPSPSPRGRYGATLDNAGRMLLFGGRFRAGSSGSYELYNDLWAFEFATRTWTQVHDGSGTAPRRRYFPMLVFDAANATLVVAGGGTNSNPLGAITAAEDVWQFKDGTWSMVTTTGDRPSHRLFEAHTYDKKRNRLVLFGGQIGDYQTYEYADLYVLELDTKIWRHLDAGTGPSGRMNSSMSYHAASDRYIVFAGHTKDGMSNDIWAWDPEGNQWHQLGAGDVFTGAQLGCLGNPAEIPKDYVTVDVNSPERRGNFFFDILGDTAWAFGGMSDCSANLDDTWSFSLGTSTWTKHTPAHAGEVCSRRGDDCTCLCL